MKTLKMVKEKRAAKVDREVPLTFASKIPKRAVSFEDGILAYFQGNSFRTKFDIRVYSKARECPK